MINEVLEKLNVKDKELEYFKKFKDNYYISDKLYIKNDIPYNIRIEYDKNNLSMLFGEEIKEKDLLYTLKCGRAIIIKRATKDKIIKYIKKELGE